MLMYQQPLHPARIARNILVDQGFKFISAKIWKVSRYFKTAYFPEDFIFHERQDIDYNIAYNLVKLLPHTTMEFWLERQRLYEYWVTNRLNKEIK